MNQSSTEILPQKIIDQLPSGYQGEEFLSTLATILSSTMDTQEESIDKLEINENRETIKQQDISILIIGDSGDGSKTIGEQVAGATAQNQHHIRVSFAYPAAIRAPKDNASNTSGAMVRAGGEKVHYPGEQADLVLVFNAAGLKSALKTNSIKPGATILADTNKFGSRELKSAGYDENPLNNDEITKKFNVIALPISTMINDIHSEFESLSESEAKLKPDEKKRTRNFFGLGILLEATNAPLKPVLDWLDHKFTGKKRKYYDANVKALLSGYAFGKEAKAVPSFEADKAEFEPGQYAALSGAEAITKALQAVAHLTGKKIIYPWYPITPASEIGKILSTLAGTEGIETANMPDEIAAAAAALGAAYAGELGVTGTSGAGISLMLEVFGLAVATEIPLVVFNVQRGGPSTGGPTKAEQGDMLQAFWGRHGHAPMIVVSPKSPEECFYKVIEAYKFALETNTPVMIMLDSTIADGVQDMRIPTLEELKNNFGELKQNNARPIDDEGRFLPFQRDENDVVPYAPPGTKGAGHIRSGLTQNKTGEVDFGVHGQEMTARANKLELLAQRLPDAELFGPEKADVIAVSYGYNFGVTREVVEELREQGKKVSHLNLTYVHPLPKNAERILRNSAKNGTDIVVVESNLANINKNDDGTEEFQGQIAYHLQGRWGININSFPHIHTGYVKKENLHRYLEIFFTKRYKGARLAHKLISRVSDKVTDWKGFDHLKEVMAYARGTETRKSHEDKENHSNVCASCVGGMISKDKTKKDEQSEHGFDTHHEIKWCPTCGDRALRDTLQDHVDKLVAKGTKRENIVMISGIGCSGRITFYFGNGFMMHVVHGRGTAFLTGLVVANPKLKVFAVGGDGDSYAIGKRHLDDLANKNIPAIIEIVRNDVFGLTKKQHAPSREAGAATSNTPFGSPERPVNGLGNLLANGATHVVRTMAQNKKHHAKMLEIAEQHKGASFLEVITMCPTFNADGYKNLVGTNNRRDGFPNRKEALLMLKENEPMIFGSKNKEFGIVMNGLKPEVVLITGENEKITEKNKAKVLVHDSTNYEQAKLLADFGFQYKETKYVDKDGNSQDIKFPLPIGTIYIDSDTPNYLEELDAMHARAQEANGGKLDISKVSDIERILASAKVAWIEEAINN